MAIITMPIGFFASINAPRDSPSGISREDKNYPNTNEYVAFPGRTKGYSPPLYNYKGLSYYPGLTNADLTEDQLSDWMNQLQSHSNEEEEEQNAVSQFFSGTKVVALAAMVPLGIMLFSFIPVLMSYFQTGPNMPSTITTIASSRMARAFTDKEFLDTTLQTLMELTKKTTKEEKCVQEAICEVMLSHGGVMNVKNIANAVNKLNKNDWLKRFYVKDIVDGLAKSNCKNLCNKSKKKNKH